MPIPQSILYLSEEEVQKTLTVAEAVDLAEKGIRADGAGKVDGDKFYMDVGDFGFIKPFSGYIEGEEYAFVKSFSYFPGNPEKYSRPTTSSQVILIDAETGLLMPAYYFSPQIAAQRMNELILETFKARREWIFPPAAGQKSLEVMRRFGYRGLLWDQLIQFGAKRSRVKKS
jgi:hypothetical protein